MNKINTVIISVSDKTGIKDFAEKISGRGIKIIATGGTASFLKSLGIPVVHVERFTGFPEILDGRVKTLHPNIHAGILADKNKKHEIELKKHGIDRIDMVVVNFYPFEKKPGKNQIDIGGVALLRASAKNYENVVPVCDIKDYLEVLERIKSDKLDKSFRKTLAAKAFETTSYYDSVISEHLSNKEQFRDIMPLTLKKSLDLRYGENPHQKAALYEIRNKSSFIKHLNQIQGKDMSYNNYLDIVSAFDLVHEFEEPCCVIVKHGSPCGVSVAKRLSDAYHNAFLCDSVSAYGGILAFNRRVDIDTALLTDKIFTECIIAPSYSESSLGIFSKKKNLRILSSRPVKTGSVPALQFSSVADGMLVQQKDDLVVKSLKVVTSKKPSRKELASLKFAYTVAKYVKSNAIVLAKRCNTVGIGAGQMSRIDSLKIALEKMKTANRPSDFMNMPLVLASDAFLPFRDIVDLAAEYGISSVIQPGGSIRDMDSINACNSYGISMVFTALRHFRH